MIQRTHELALIEPLVNQDQIKLILGIRRCGKTVFMKQIQDEVRKHSTNIIDLDFELDSVSSTIKSGRDLIRYVNSHRGRGTCYLFLDEPKDPGSWNASLQTLRNQNTSIFIACSSSFTLEQLTHTVTIQIRPFVYQQMKQYADQMHQSFTIQDYLLFGGFPSLITLTDSRTKYQYLQDLFSTIILNEILMKHPVQKPALFLKTANKLLQSNCQLLSASSIAEQLNSHEASCSITTVQTYIRYLKEAFIISSIDQYDAKIKRNLLYYEKLYDTDVGFNTMLRQNRDMDLTHNFENAIYNELLFKGYSLIVFRYGDYEIDFLASKNHVDYLIQAAYSIAENSTREREFRPFDLTDNSMRKIMISNDDFDLSTGTVKHIKFKDFLELDDLNDAF